jgi:hypothetical protein
MRSDDDLVLSLIALFVAAVIAAAALVWYLDRRHDCQRKGGEYLSYERKCIDPDAVLH